MKNEAENDNLVLPGEPLAVIEESLYDENCYEDENGVIRSKVLGKAEKKNYKIHVEKKKNVLMPERGKEIIGYVTGITGKSAYLDIYYIKGKEKFIETSVPFSAKLRQRHVPAKYCRSMRDIVRPGEWILGRVINDDPTLISFRGRPLGVLKAFCIYCGAELTPTRREEMQCTNSDCGAKQKRFHSVAYGFNNYDFKLTDKE